VASFEYANRRAVGAVEHRFILEDDSLLVAREGGGTVRVPLAAIREIRLHYQPNRYESDVYECTVSTAGDRWRIFSRYVRGALDFRDQGQEYRAFVTELCARRGRAAPPGRFSAGVSPGRFAGNALAAGAGTAFLLLALTLLPIGGSLFIALRLVVILPLLLVSVLWFVRNRPGRFDPNAIPASLLPKASAEEVA
jgi:hypothetical protein